MNNSRTKRQTYDVFVGNLPNSFNEKRLTQKFTAYGETLNVLIRPDKKNGKYVIFKYLCEPDSLKAVQECNNQEWEGTYITVRGDKRTQNSSTRREHPNFPLQQQQEFHMRNWNPPYPMNDAGRNSYQPSFPANPISNGGAIKSYQAFVPQSTSIKNKNSSPLELIEFHCTSVESITTFYGNRFSQIQELNNIQTNLQHECATIAESIASPQTGEICAALFSEDKTWYRCIVLNDRIPSKPGMCTIKYIDYGNTEDVYCKSLVKLSKSMKTPLALAVKCVLQVEETTSLKEEARKFIQEHLLWQRVFVWTYAPNDIPISISKCVCNNADVFEELAKRGYIVKPVSPQTIIANNNSNSQQPDVQILPKQLISTAPLLPLPPTCSGDIYKGGPYASQIPSPVTLPNRNNNSRARPPEKYEQRPNAPPGTIPYNNMKPTGGSSIVEKLHTFNSKVQKAPSGVPYSQHPSMGSSKPNQRVVGAECRPGKIQILQRHVVNEAPPSQDVMKLLAERDALEKQLNEQYSHVQDLRLEIKQLHEELDKESMSRKIDSIISRLKLVNRIRDLVSSSTIWHFIDSTIKGLKSEQKKLDESKVKRKEVELTSALHSKSLQQITECKDKTNLAELVAEKNRYTENLLTALKQYLDHVDSSLCNTKSFIEKSIKELQSNANMYMDITLDKVPSSMDELIMSYQHIWESKQERLHKMRDSTNEEHRAVMGLLSELQNKFSLHITSNGGDTQDEEPASNTLSEENESGRLFSSELVDSLTHLKDALSTEIAIYALNNDGKTDTSIIQLLLTEINAFEKQILENFTFYEKYSGLYKKISISSSSVDDTLSDLSGVKSNMKSIKSKLRHKLADKKDLEENEEVSSDAVMKLDFEIGSLQYQLHSLFQEEDSLKEELVHAYSSIYPEINVEHPELKLHCHPFVKQSWDPEHFTLRKLSNRPGVEYESKFMNKVVIIKEFVLENEDKMNEFITTVEKWDAVNSDFLVKIRALFLKNERIMYTLIPEVSPSLVNCSSDLSEAKSRLILHQVLKGLNDLHSKGLIHGALNPHAVLCCDDNVVLDFFFGMKYNTGMSEFKRLSFQSRDIPLTQASDMYSFGCLILWVLFPNLPVSADFLNSTKAMSFKSALDQTLSVEEQLVVFTLFENSECRPSAKELLDSNFLMNFPRPPSVVAKDEIDLEIDPKSQEVSTNDQMGSEGTAIVSDSKMADFQDLNSVEFSPASTAAVDSVAIQDLTSQTSVELSPTSTVDLVAEQDLTSQISVEFSSDSTMAVEPQEDSNSSTPEDNVQYDIFGSLNALRQPLGARKPPSDTTSKEVVVEPLVDEALSSAQDDMSDVSIPTPPEHPEIDTLATLNSLRSSLEVLKFADTEGGHSVASLPDTTSILTNSDSGESMVTQDHQTVATESTSQECDMPYDSSPTEASEPSQGKSQSLDDGLDVTSIKEDREGFVTEEQRHMLDYVPIEEV